MGLGQILIAVCVTAVVPHVNRSHFRNVKRAVVAKVLVNGNKETENKTTGRHGMNKTMNQWRPMSEREKGFVPHCHALSG